MEIFISSTMKDMQEERNAVTEVLNSIQQLVSRAEYFFASPESPHDLCMSKARNCDIFVGIYRDAYGSVPNENNPKGISVTEMEYQAAGEEGIPRLVFIHVDKSKREPALNSFLERVQNFSKGTFRKTYSNIEDLKYQVFGSLVIQLKLLPHLTDQQRDDLDALVKDEIRYRSSLKKRIEFIDFKGIPQVQRVITIRLKDIYVPISLSLTKSLTEEPIKVDPDSQSWYYTSSLQVYDDIPVIPVLKKKKGPMVVSEHQTLTRQTLGDLMEMKSSKMVVLGSPASGKTTLLRNTILNVLESNSIVFPILLSLRDFGNALEKDPSTSLASFLDSATTQSFDIKEGFIINHLRAGSCLILLDGMDEVIESRLRKIVARKVEEFASQYDENNSIILTSRIIGYRDAQLSGSFDHFRIDPFDKSQIANFVQKWFYIVSKAERSSDFDQKSTDDQVDKTVRRIIYDPNIFQIATSPLLLTILCLMSRQGIPFPSNVIELYDYAIETMIQTWDLNKGLEIQMKSQDMFDLLRSIAVWYHTLGYTTCGQDQLIEFLKEQVIQKGIGTSRADQVAHDFLKSAKERSGIFLELGLEEYGFVHNALRDFLVAVELSGMNDIDKVYDDYFKNFIHASKNYEVILSTAAYLSRIHREKSSKFIERILDEETEYESVIFLNLHLALACIERGASIVAGTKNKILERIKEAVASPYAQYLYSNFNYHYLMRIVGTPLESDFISLLEGLSDEKPLEVLTLIHNTEARDDFDRIIKKCYTSLLSKPDISKGNEGYIFYLLTGRPELAEDHLKRTIRARSLTDDATISYMRELINDIDFENDEFVDFILSDAAVSIQRRVIKYAFVLGKPLHRLVARLENNVELRSLIKGYQMFEAGSLRQVTLMYLRIILGDNKLRAHAVKELSGSEREIQGDDIRKLLDLALPAAEEVCLDISRLLFEFIRYGDITYSDLEIQLRNSNDSFINKKLMLAYFSSEFSHPDSAILEVMKNIIVDPLRPPWFRRHILNNYQDKIATDASSLEWMFSLIGDEELFNNIANFLIWKHFRLEELVTLVSEKIKKDGADVDLLSAGLQAKLG